MGDIVVRHTIPDVFVIREELREQLRRVESLDNEIRYTMEQINGYSPIRIERIDRIYSLEDPNKKSVDRYCWKYFIRLYELEKFMLCTEYDKVMKDVEELKFPDFTIENAESWLDGLKMSFVDYIRDMIKRVCREIIDGCYYTGSGGYNSQKKKKRNNNGIDKMFILHTSDYRRVFSYSSIRPTITDDLEKVCYVIDGKKPPVSTIIGRMKGDKSSSGECPYFSIKACKNGNTHYTLTTETRDKLNLCGMDDKILAGIVSKIVVFE
jgi:hypothetical protein